METKIQLTGKFKKQIQKVPSHIQEAASVWIESVKEIGLEQTNVAKGYNAEHLKGPRKGQRSVRMNKAYRVIYTVENGEVQVICLLEINKHKY
jgi:proteic killer suppression protein